MKFLIYQILNLLLFLYLIPNYLVVESVNVIELDHVL